VAEKAFQRIGLVPCLLALLLASCATPEPVEPEVRTGIVCPRTIKIQSYPAGALIDINGDILGTSPVEYSAHPHNAAQWWPQSDLIYQRFRARWPNGVNVTETFLTRSPMPRQVGLLAPQAWFPASGTALR
jgi:hypothetical protein